VLKDSFKLMPDRMKLIIANIQWINFENRPFREGYRDLNFACEQAIQNPKASRPRQSNGAVEFDLKSPPATEVKTDVKTETVTAPL
jgi:hypothetical protein